MAPERNNLNWSACSLAELKAHADPAIRLSVFELKMFAWYAGYTPLAVTAANNLSPVEQVGRELKAVPLAPRQIRVDARLVTMAAGGEESRNTPRRQHLLGACDHLGREPKVN